MGEVVQFIPRPNPNREANLERQAIEIMNVALMGGPPAPSPQETACSEMSPDESA